MEVKTCRNCGCIFNYTGFGPRICPNCKDTLEAKFQEVKEYVWNNKGINIATVAEDCDVSEQQIREWIREERLEFASGDFGLSCEKCGRTITSGRFCEMCKTAMINSLNNAIKKDIPIVKHDDHKDGGPKMRFVK